MQANLLWTGREYYSLENCLVNMTNAGVSIDSVIVGLHQDSLYRVDYKIETNSRWQTVSFELGTQVFDEKKIHRFESNGTGKWTSEGKPCPQFDGCIDIDIPLTPFTNTLPIRRLSLGVGQSEEIRVVYLDVLEKKFSAVRQKYQRLSERKYKYENVPNDFEAEIAVDDDGFVVDYPGLFVRTARKNTNY